MNYTDHLLEAMRIDWDCRLKMCRAANARRDRAMEAHPIGSTFSMLGTEFVVVEYGHVSQHVFDVTVTYKNAAGEVRNTTWKSSQFPICEWVGESA